MKNEKNTSILKWLVVMVALGGLLMFENKLSYADIIDNEGNIVLEVNESDISFYNETFDSLLDEVCFASLLYIILQRKNT